MTSEKAGRVRLSVHHHRQRRVLQDVPRYSAKNPLPQTGVGIGAHDQQVAVELFGRRQQTSSYDVIDWFVHPQISRHAMHRQVGLKFWRLWTMSLILFSPENAYSFSTL